MGFLVDRGFQRDKIVAGVPFYGKEFVGGTNREVKDVAYRDLLPRLADPNAGALGHTFHETPELAARKAQYVLDENLAGLMFFELSMDLPPESPHSLLAALNRHVSPSHCPGGH